MRFSEALRFWIKLGFISFGGPAGQIAIMHRELVERRRWLSEERFTHALNYCMLLPGPEAQQLATYIGWLMHRTAGGIAAGAFFVIPSVFLLLALSYIYAAYGSVMAVAGVLNGFKPVVVAIVVEALVKIGRRAIKNALNLAIAAAAFVSIYFLQIPFPLIVLGAAIAGLLFSSYFPDVAKTSAKNDSEDSSTELSLDEHTRPSRRRVATIAVVGIGLWLLPFALLVASTGYDGLFATDYRFFTVAAFVTFGGAYAVLAYVTQAVTAAPYNWITPTQAVDGLALAETTPGPLIMVLQFVGFMAGWNNPVAGLSPLASGVIGALITTYATFLPSFLFIFLGAPYIESLRGNKWLGGALSAVTAAVVGVILNLTLVFGSAVFFPEGVAGRAEVFAVAVSAAALLLLMKFKVDVLWVILAGGLIGLAGAYFVR